MPTAHENSATDQPETARESVASHRQGPLLRIKLRLQGDFYLSLVTLFSFVSIVVFTPFFFYRMALGELPAALGNGVLVLLLSAIWSYAWVTGRTAGARYLVVAVIGTIAVYMVNYVGHYPYWLYPTVLTIFLLVNWRSALPINAVLLILVLVGSERLASPVDMVSFAGSMTLVSAFTMIFVVHSDFHRNQLADLLERDPLTDALNRRGMAVQLSKALEEHRHSGKSHALAVMDIDNFKQINDSYGHEAGDKVLIEFARRVMKSIRQSDQFYRLGGEEFVVKFSDISQRDASKVLEKIMAEVRRTTHLAGDRLTISAGLAMADSSQSWSEWLDRADQAMYMAKTQGKDCYVLADSASASASS